MSVFDDEVLTIDELASFLKLKRQTIYRLAQQGKLPGAKIGKEWRFRKSIIEEWLEQNLGSPRASVGTSSNGDSAVAGETTETQVGPDHDPRSPTPGRRKKQGPSRN